MLSIKGWTVCQLKKVKSPNASSDKKIHNLSFTQLQPKSWKLPFVSPKWNIFTFGKSSSHQPRKTLLWHVMPSLWICEQKMKVRSIWPFYPLSIGLNVFDAWKCKQSQSPMAWGKHWTSIIASLYVSCSLKGALCTKKMPYGIISVTIQPGLENLKKTCIYHRFQMIIFEFLK